MKTFVFTKRYQKGYNNVFISIYRVVKNEPTYIGYTEFSSSSTVGDKSEVLQKLIELKYIPKKLYHTSKCSWRGSGYYCPEVEKMGYKIIGLYN